MRRRLLATLPIAVLMLAGASASWAEGYPDKPITVVVPTNPGGRVDVTARLFASIIQDKKLLPVPMVVHNVTGSGGAIGTRQVMTAPADGYTVAFWNAGVLTAKAMGLADFGIDAFDVIAQTGVASVVLATQKDSRFTDLKSLIDYAKAHPRTVLDATNIGTQPFFATQMLAQAAGVTFRPVQVGGGAKRVQSLMGHHADIAIFAVSAFKEFEPGGLRALAILSKPSATRACRTSRPRTSWATTWPSMTSISGLRPRARPSRRCRR